MPDLLQIGHFLWRMGTRSMFGSGIILDVNNLKRYLLLSFCLLFSLGSVPARTDQDLFPPLAILEIDLRPEFDQPGVLVVYHMVLSSDTKLPATMTVRIPSRVKEPNQVAWVDPVDASMTNIPYQNVLSGDWNEITFTTSAYEVNFEYYDSALSINSTNQRTYEYDWSGDYAVTNLSIYIQQPLGATDMVISPGLGSPRTGENNVVYYYSRLGEVDQSTVFSIKMTYTKADSNLSIEQLQVKPAGDLNEATSGRTSLGEMLPWLIGFIGLLLLLGIAWWVWLMNFTNKNIRQFRLADLFGARREEPAENAVYCQQCGNRAGKGDVFCRICGSKLRVGDHPDR
jgi:hypothetical protein